MEERTKSPKGTPILHDTFSSSQELCYYYIRIVYILPTRTYISKHDVQNTWSRSVGMQSIRKDRSSSDETREVVVSARNIPGSLIILFVKNKQRNKKTPEELAIDH